jgi:DNA polymerase-3 subunit delta'
MNIASYLDNYQPLLRRQFAAALKHGHLSHAYLLTGEPGTPLLEIATYLAKSLVCENPDPFADETCWSCLRIDDGNYADIVIYNGALTTIKKDDIQNLEASFEKTPVEPAGRLIYILHLVENLTPEAINSLLKFLEEPHQEVYAFLTTENESKVLETIISRSQRLRVLPADRKAIVAESIAAGIAPEDAEMLSFFHHDVDTMRMVSQEDYYRQTLSALQTFFETLVESYDMARYQCLNDIVERFVQKEALRFLIDVLVLFLTDILARQNGQAPLLPSYDKILGPLKSRFAHLEAALLEVLLARGQIELNVNASLLLDHIFIRILKEYIHDAI